MKFVKECKALDELGFMEFIYNSSPRCPHCGENFDIRENEAWYLYDENGPHEVECSSCEREFEVSSHADWKFSTDEQERY